MMADFDKLRDFAAAFDGHVFRGKDGTSLHTQTGRTPKADSCALCHRNRIPSRRRVCAVPEDSKPEEQAEGRCTTRSDR